MNGSDQRGGTYSSIRRSPDPDLMVDAHPIADRRPPIRRPPIRRSDDDLPDGRCPDGRWPRSPDRPIRRSPAPDPDLPIR